MKKSRQVVLLITGSVLLTACNQEQNQVPSYSVDFGTNNPGASNSSRYVGPGGTVVHHSPIIYPWYHPSRYFGPGSSSSRSGLSSPDRSGSGSSGASHPSSSPSRGGFGSHSTSSS